MNCYGRSERYLPFTCKTPETKGIVDASGLGQDQKGCDDYQQPLVVV